MTDAPEPVLLTLVTLDCSLNVIPCFCRTVRKVFATYTAPSPTSMSESRARHSYACVREYAHLGVDTDATDCREPLDDRHLSIAHTMQHATHTMRREPLDNRLLSHSFVCCAPLRTRTPHSREAQRTRRAYAATFMPWHVTYAIGAGRGIAVGCGRAEQVRTAHALWRIVWCGAVLRRIRPTYLGAETRPDRPELEADDSAADHDARERHTRSDQLVYAVRPSRGRTPSAMDRPHNSRATGAAGPGQAANSARVGSARA